MKNPWSDCCRRTEEDDDHSGLHDRLRLPRLNVVSVAVAVAMAVELAVLKEVAVVDGVTGNTT